MQNTIRELLVILFGAFMLSACNSLSIVTPVDPLPEYKGPGSITGVVRFTGPVLRVSASPDLSDAAYMPLCPGTPAFLYPVGSDIPARQEYYWNRSWTRGDNATGWWEMDMSYQDLAYGSYNIRIAWWDRRMPMAIDYDYYELAAGPVVTLSESQPNADAGTVSLATFTPEGTGIIRGRILVNCSNSNSMLGTLGVALEQDEAGGDWFADMHPAGAAWDVSTLALSEGRAYFEVRGLPAGLHTFSGYAFHSFLDFGMVNKYEITDMGQPIEGVMLHYINNNTLESDQQVKRNWIQGRVWFPEAQDWSGDLQLIARSVDDPGGRYREARYFLFSSLIPYADPPGSDYGAFGCLELREKTDSIVFKIGPLKPGQYEISALLLGDASNERLELSLGAPLVTLPDSIVPFGYVEKPETLAPWDTNVTLNLSLSEAQAQAFAD